MVDAVHWQQFSKRDQLGHIGAEVFRAAQAQKRDRALTQKMLERALELVDLSINDAKWREDALLLWRLRDEIAKAYIGQTDDIARLYSLL